MTKRLLINAAKFGVSALLVGYLVWQAWSEAQKGQWQAGPAPDWSLLAGAWVVTLGALVLTIVRWFLLVRALDIPFRLRDAFRLGFLGYMLNFVALGSVGGDFFRAVFIAREAKDHRAEAVATVVIDRIIGLYVLFVMAAIACWLNGLWESDVPEIRAVCWLSWISSIVGFIGIVMLIVPGFTTGAVSEFLGNLPKIGPTVAKLIKAVRIYRTRPGVLLQVTLLTVGVHTLSTVGFYLGARGLVADVPSLAEHFVIVPLSMVAGALPLPMMGLGAVEFTLELLYRHVPDVAPMATGNVLKVAACFRVIQILNALIGGVVWWFSRGEMAELMHSAEGELAEG